MGRCRIGVPPRNTKRCPLPSSVRLPQEHRLSYGVGEAALVQSSRFPLCMAGEVLGDALAPLQLGEGLPDVEAEAHTGDRLSLRAYQGSGWLVVFTFPESMTPVCATVRWRGVDVDV